MSNKILTIVTIAAMGAGAYIYTQHQDENTPYNVLDYVPADTPIFAGQLKPFPIKNYLLSSPHLVNPAEIETLERQYQQTENPQGKFFLSLAESYKKQLGNADEFTAQYGLADNIHAYFYTLGLMPVFKLEVEKPDAMWALLDKTEKESGFMHKKGEINNLNYRAYTLMSPEDNEQKIGADLIIAINNGYLTATLNSTLNKPELLESALGLIKSENSLADSPLIDNIIAEHSFKDNGIAFLNHVEIMKGITSKDSNQLAQQLTALSTLSEEDNLLSKFRSPECQTDLASISSNWPRTVAGYNEINISKDGSSISVSNIIESKNKVILEALSSLRGYIPNYTKDVDNLILASGIAIDVKQLSNTLTSVWSDLTTPIYTCQPLAALQGDIAKAGDSLAMVGMAANAANGLQGISFGLNDYKVSKSEGGSQNGPNLDNLDFIFAVSAENPLALFNTAKMFLPELQKINLSNNGEAVPLNDYFPVSGLYRLTPKIAIKGKHLVFYNGQKAEEISKSMASEPLSKNGLFGFSFDFSKMIAPLVTAAEIAGEPLPKEAQFLTEYDAKVKASFDVQEKGLVFTSEVVNNP